MRPPEPLPRLARWLLGWRRLGERRAEVEGDLLDVYGSRCASHEPHLIAALASTLGVVALVLALMGLYGVTAFVTTQRTREIGVRIALGATQSEVFAMVVRQAMRPVVIGLAVGLGVTALGARLVMASVYGVSPTDPLAVGFAVGLLVVSATAASILPAERAAHLDPARVLRQS